MQNISVKKVTLIMNKERLCEIDTALTSEYWQLSATDPVVVADQDDFPRKLGRVWEGSWTPLFTRSNEGINIQQQKCQKYTIIHVNCPRWDTRLSMTTALAALRWRWQTMLCVFRSSHSCVVRGQWSIILDFFIQFKLFCVCSTLPNRTSLTLLFAV